MGLLLLHQGKIAMPIRIIDSVLTLYIVIMMVVMMTLMIKNKKHIKSIKYLFLVPLTGFIQLLYTQILVYLFPENKNLLTDSIVVVYMMTEFFCFLYYLTSYLNINKIYNNILASSMLLTIIGGCLIDVHFLEKWYFVYILIESVLFIILSLIIISKITLNDEITELKINPDFLISSAIFFTFSYFAPFYAIRRFLLNDIEIYIKIQTLVIVFGYSIFYTLLTYAIRWKIIHSKS